MSNKNQIYAHVGGPAPGTLEHAQMVALQAGPIDNSMPPGQAAPCPTPLGTKSLVHQYCYKVETSNQQIEQVIAEVIHIFDVLFGLPNLGESPKEEQDKHASGFDSFRAALEDQEALLSNLLNVVNDFRNILKIEEKQPNG